MYDEVSELGARGMYKETIEKADSVLSLNISDSLRAYVMLERMVAMSNSGDMHEAMIYSKSVEDFSSRHGINEVTISALVQQGLAYRRENKNDSALIFYQKALNMSIDDNNKDYEQYVCDLLSILYAETGGHKDEALKFSKRSLEIAEEMQDTTSIVSAVATIGGIYMKEGEYGKALDVQLSYMPMMESVHAGVLKIKFLTPIIKAYLQRNITDSAKYYIGMAESMLGQLPEGHQTGVVILNAKAELLGKEHRYIEQQGVYDRIDSLGTHGKSADILLLERAECKYNQGDNGSAYKMMKDAYSKLDSIRKSEIEANMSDFAMKYDTFQKEMKIEKLRMERIIWIAVSLVLAVIFIAIIAYLRYKKEKLRQKMALEQQAVYIRGLETERERIAKELHDGICNEMLAMTFILADDSEAVSRISELTAKVRHLSHELMPPQFKNGNLCQLLINYVMMMNSNNTETSITITDEGCYDWEKLPSEHSFELYRMVQESINNALKHAIPKYIKITLDGTSASYKLTIENDGAHENTDNAGGKTQGIGMQTLQARADNIGAEISVVREADIYKIIIQN